VVWTCWTNWSVRIRANAPPADGQCLSSSTCSTSRRTTQWCCGKSDVQRHFLRELGMQLVAGHATARSNLPQSKCRRIQDSARQSVITSPAASDTSQVRQDRRRRCTICPRNNDHQTNKRCSTCGTPVCKQHSTSINAIACPSCTPGGPSESTSR